MDLNNEILIETFAKNFLLKEKRERCLLELKSFKKRTSFIEKLNHKWNTQFNMEKLVRLQKNVDDFDFIKRFLIINGNDLCYIVSNYKDIDNKTLDFEQAFNNSYGRGFATLLIFGNANKIYLETEVEYGQQNRFVGKIS